MRQCNSVLSGTNRLLDLIFINLPDCKVSHEAFPLAVEDKYHPCLNIVISITQASYADLPVRSDAKIYNFKKANYPLLYATLLQTDWSFLERFDDLSDVSEAFYKVLYEILDKYVPTIK